MIEVGDIVTVNKDDIGLTLLRSAEILNKPRDVGDPWGFRNTETNGEVWTTERITVYKEPPK
jgi:hypothetical protein